MSVSMPRTFRISSAPIRAPSVSSTHAPNNHQQMTSGSRRLRGTTAADESTCNFAPPAPKREPARFPRGDGFHHNPAVDALTKPAETLDRRLEIAVLIPCLNEAAGIASVVQSLDRKSVV